MFKWSPAAGSIDRAMHALGGFNVSSRLFLTVVMNEFKFDNKLNADKHLLALYLSFEDGPTPIAVH